MTKWDLFLKCKGSTYKNQRNIPHSENGEGGEPAGSSQLMQKKHLTKFDMIKNTQQTRNRRKLPQPQPNKGPT